MSFMSRNLTYDKQLPDRHEPLTAHIAASPGQRHSRMRRLFIFGGHFFVAAARPGILALGGLPYF